MSILKIILYIFALLLEGMSERAAIEAAADHFGVSASLIREHL